MTKYTPTTESFHILNASSDYPVDGGLSLDAIATEYYGKEYVSQQVGYRVDGHFLPNDSVHYFDMSEDEVADALWDEGPKRHYLGWDARKQTSLFHDGHNHLEYWKSLSYSKDPWEVTHPNNPRSGEDCYGAVFAYDFQVYREAPPIPYVLADLIKTEVLPYGKYLLFVGW